MLHRWNERVLHHSNPIFEFQQIHTAPGDHVLMKKLCADVPPLLLSLVHIGLTYWCTDNKFRSPLSAAQTGKHMIHNRLAASHTCYGMVASFAPAQQGPTASKPAALLLQHSTKTACQCRSLARNTRHHLNIRPLICLGTTICSR